VRLAAKTTHAVSSQMIERVAAQGAGMSIADLERVLAQASVMALRNEGVIDDAILGEAFEKVTLGEAKAGADPLRTARHEAGHALVMSLTGHPPIYVTIVGRGAFGGYAAFEDKEERKSQTKRELEDRICQILGGREAERLFYDAGDGDSTGPSNDLERATGIAEEMVYELGMAEEVGFVRVDRRRPLPEELAGRCHAAVRRLIEAQSERAQGLLASHRETLERIVAALIERNRLLKEELLELFSAEERQLVDNAAQ
jgi:cell division protease FtsH